jgi:hypothetical protein
MDQLVAAPAVEAVDVVYVPRSVAVDVMVAGARVIEQNVKGPLSVADKLIEVFFRKILIFQIDVESDRLHHCNK